MHEDDKIKEAGYFLTLLHAKQNEPNEFPHLLSAFLAAARSVTQYALKEAGTTPKAARRHSASSGMTNKSAAHRIRCLRSCGMSGTKTSM